MTMTRAEHTISGLEMIVEKLRERAKTDEKELRSVIRERDRALNRLAAINEYDRLVQGVIKSNPNLELQWDAFRVLYQLTATDELVATARDKIRLHPRKTDNGDFDFCKGCGRLKHDDPLFPEAL